jgi:hypothetical protein
LWGISQRNGLKSESTEDAIHPYSGNKFFGSSWDHAFYGRYIGHFSSASLYIWFVCLLAGVIDGEIDFLLLIVGHTEWKNGSFLDPARRKFCPE